MYFKDRSDAGNQLAAELMNYRDDDVVVMALSDGAVVVGQAITAALGGSITLLLTKDIMLPGEQSVVGTVDQSGGFTYNNMFSAGELEEYVSEFHNYLEGAKMNRVSEINHLLSNSGLMDRAALQDKVIIIVSDGARSGVSFDAAMNYLKPVRFKRLVMAAPLASVQAIDRMHLLGDEIHVLSVVDNFFETDHYYADNKIPSADSILKLLTEIGLKPRIARRQPRTYT